MNSVEWLPYESKHLLDYQNFSKNYFGFKSYQSKTNYLDWLYKENPLSINKEDFLIGIENNNNEVIGCIHKMVLSWKINSQILRVPALHNLIVNKNYRNGSGFMLIMKSISNEEKALMPGVIEPFSKFYRSMKCQKISSSWFGQWLKPISGGLYFSAEKILGNSPNGRFFDLSKINLEKNSNYIISMNPDNEILIELADLMNYSDKIASTFWDMNQLKWRFFNPIGPKNILIYEKYKETISNYAIISLGPHKGINIARIIACNTSSASSFKLLLEEIKKIARLSGGHYLQLFNADNILNQKIIESGWQPIKNSPDTYIFHRKRSSYFDKYAFTGSAGDFGFEGIQ
jgi:hypothetical protein